MKFSILSAFIMSFILGEMAVAQTTVSGGIYSNTTWTLANSPYLVTNNIVVFPGATLTIEPGVEVRVKENGLSGTQYYIETRGVLNMVGQPSAPITFRADSAVTTVGAWKGFVIKNSQGGSINYNYVNISNAVNCFDYDAGVPGSIQLNDCSFSYNFYAITVALDLIAENCTFTHNDVALYGWSNFTLGNCVFDNNVAAMNIYANELKVNNCLVSNNNLGIRLNSGSIGGIQVKNTFFENNVIAFDNANNGLIDSCTFIDNSEAVINTTYLNVKNCNFSNNTTALQVGFGTEVSDCEILQNGTGVALGPISFGQPMPVIVNNRICSSLAYNIDNRTDLNMFIPSNCFCTDDSADIEAKILDGYDDITKGLISYEIFDTSCVNVLKVVNKVGQATSVNETVSKDLIQVYPVPANQNLTINNSGKITSYRMLSLEGKELINGILYEGDNVLDVSQISAGVYFISLEDAGQKSRLYRWIHD